MGEGEREGERERVEGWREKRERRRKRRGEEGEGGKVERERREGEERREASMIQLEYLLSPVLSSIKAVRGLF